MHPAPHQNDEAPSKPGPRKPGLQGRAAELRASALGRLGFLLSAAQDPVDAARYVVETAFEFFHWDASFLVLYNADTDRVSDLVNMDTIRGRRRQVASVLENKPPSRMMRRVFAEGGQLLLRQQARDESEDTVPFGDKGRRSFSLMYVPVHVENRPIGVLSVQSYQKGAYTAADLQALQNLADHTAGALARLQAEAELHASEERLRLAVESARLGTWEYEPATGLFTCSLTCQRMLALEAPQRLDFETFLSRVTTQTDPRTGAQVRQALRPRSPGRLHLECRLQQPGHPDRWVILRVRKFLATRNHQRPTVRLIGTVLDISERKRAEQLLSLARDELRDHARELEQTVERRTARLRETVAELQHFSYALTHDMRAPLRAMQMFADLLEQEFTVVAQPQSLHFLALIKAASRRLDQLIQDSLNYAKVLQNQVPLKPVALRPLLSGLLQTYPKFQTSGGSIVLEELPVVMGNEAALTQCFAGLLDNAIKFVLPGHAPTVRIRAQTADERVRIWVEDHGIGIPRYAQQHIFEMFQRATDKYEGTGIGLAIVRKLAQRMGGTVGVKSVEGRGSRFWVELKLAHAAPPPLRRSKNEP